MTSSENDQLVRTLILQLLLWSAISGAILFTGAGTLRWPEGWVFLALWFAAGLASSLALARDNPEILKERMRPLRQEDQKDWDKPILIGILLGWVALHFFAGVDVVRWRWSNIPGWIEAAGAVLMLAGFYAMHRVLRENAFAAPIVKIDTERGHRVIDTGPYAVVRHPMYAGAVLYFAGTALLLGSWLALAIGAALCGLLALRAVWEEDALKAELPGYAAYAERVRHRIVPGVW